MNTTTTKTRATVVNPKTLSLGLREGIASKLNSFQIPSDVVSIHITELHDIIKFSVSLDRKIVAIITAEEIPGAGSSSQWDYSWDIKLKQTGYAYMKALRLGIVQEPIAITAKHSTTV